jgi:hypothetical protein
MHQANAFDPARVRRNLVLTLVASIAIANLFIVLPDDESRSFFSNWTINAAAAAALGMSLMITWRQKLGGLYGRTYAAFAAGLALWFVAEILWTYYELGAGIEDPFPSLADAFWIAGYAPFAYHLTATYRFFGKAVQPYVIIIVSIAAALFVGHTSTLVFTTSIPTTQEELTTTIISVAYLVLDAVLIVPAIIVLASLRRGKLTLTPWFLLSSSLLVMVAADSGFAYYEAAGLTDGMWVWDMFYATSYITIAATLFWHYKFFIYNEKKVKKIWQDENS